MADLDPIGPLKPTIPPAKRKNQQRKPDEESTNRGPAHEQGDENSSGKDPTHAVDEYV